MIRLFDEIPHLADSRIELRRIGFADADSLCELAHSTRVYRYLPTFLIERQYEDMHEVIRRIYGECICRRESLILGIYLGCDGSFCGLVEMYGYREIISKVSIGYRLLERYWGMGLATAAVGLMVDYLYSVTDIEIITASTMVENKASANVLKKNDFTLAASAVGEDWGYPDPTIADKWIR